MANFLPWPTKILGRRACYARNLWSEDDFSLKREIAGEHMNRYGYRLGLGIALLLSLGACLAEPPDTEESVAGTDGALTLNGVSAVLNVNNDWGGGYCAAVTLTNTSSAPVTTWQAVLNTNGSTISQIWNGSYTQTGTSLTVNPVAYNAAIAPAGTASFGFCGNGAGRPSIVSLTVSGGSTGGAGGAPGTSTSSSTSRSTSSGSGGSAGCMPPAPGSKGMNPLFSDKYTADPAPMVDGCTFYI